MWKYNGQGFIVGIPARDLTDEEAKQYQPRVKYCGLYEHKKDKPPKKYQHQVENDPYDDLGQRS